MSFSESLLIFRQQPAASKYCDADCIARLSSFIVFASAIYKCIFRIYQMYNNHLVHCNHTTQCNSSFEAQCQENQDSPVWFCVQKQCLQGLVK